MNATTPKTFRAILAAAAFLSLTAAPALARTFEHTFDVGDGGELRVDTDVGSIEVRASGSGEVEVRVEVSGTNAEDFEVDFSERDGNPVVRGKSERSRSWFGGWRSPRVRFEITVPRRFDVDLETSGGSIEVSSLEGEVRAETSGGSLKFGDIEGPVRGRTSGGSIELRGAAGNADLETSGGSIRVGDVDGEVRAHTSGGSIGVEQVRGEVDVATSGGSIRLEEVAGAVSAETSGGSVTATIIEQPRHDCRLTTSGGGVTVYLADGIAVDLDARASGGRLTSDFPLGGERKTRTSLAGEINGGGPVLYLRGSGGGGVRVLRR